MVRQFSDSVSVALSPEAGAPQLERSVHPLVGVVTPVRNRAEWTLPFASRLLEQTYLQLKFYFVDSGSTDGTPEKLEALGSPAINVVSVDSSLYWTGATNAGVRRALAEGCEYVLTINDDAIVAPDFVAEIVAAAVRHGAPLVGSVISYAENPGKFWGVGAYNDWESGKFVQTGRAGEWDDGSLAETDLIATDYLCGNGTLVHRSVFDAIGYYDARGTPHYHADTEFTVRAERAGIPRSIATRARLYNRFTGAADGPFATKNVRFFSLRSANFAKTIFFLVKSYCPVELRPEAFVSYYIPYLKGAKPRLRSKLLRAAFLLSLPPEQWPSFIPKLLPPRSLDLTVCSDLELLCALPARPFAVLSYAYILERRAGEEEIKARVAKLAQGASRQQLLLEIYDSAERKQYGFGSLSLEKRALLDARLAPNFLSEEVSRLTDCQFVILCFLAILKRLPSNTELAHFSSDASQSSRADLIEEIASKARATSAASPSLDKTVHVLKAWTRNESIRNDNAAGGDFTVYMNIDVLCMGQIDLKARTGVYRYAAAVLKALLQRKGFALKVFYTPELEIGWQAYVKENPAMRSLLLAEDGNLPSDRPAVTFFPYFPFAVPEKKFDTLPRLMTLHDLFPVTHPEWFSEEASISFRRKVRDLLQADAIICVSGATQQEVYRNFNEVYHRTSVIYSASDSVFAPRAQRLSEKIETFRTGLFGKKYFVCVGTLEPRKNLKAVLRAFSALVENHEDVELVVVGQQGWGDAAQLLEQTTCAKVRFLGRVEDQRLARIYRNAYCTVFPSLGEGFGLPIVESLSCGTPVITSNRSAMAELGGEACIFVDPDDWESIHAAMQRALTQPAYIDELKRKALIQAAKFSWARCAEEHEGLLRKVARTPMTQDHIRPKVGAAPPTL